MGAENRTFGETPMIRLRPYKPADAAVILSWCQDPKTFYQWTAGMLGDYPASEKDFAFVESLMPFTAFDETGILGFFTLRTPRGSPEELRFGFVIVSPDRRGTGCGKAMLRLGLNFALNCLAPGGRPWGSSRTTPPPISATRRPGFTMWFSTSPSDTTSPAKSGHAESWRRNPPPAELYPPHKPPAR